jgi:hypothetical protein
VIPTIGSVARPGSPRIWTLDVIDGSDGSGASSVAFEKSRRSIDRA